MAAAGSAGSGSSLPAGAGRVIFGLLFISAVMVAVIGGPLLALWWEQR